MFSSLLAFFVVGLLMLGVVAILGVFFSLALGVVAVLLFKVLPILLIGWIGVKLMQRFTSRRAISASDRRWLDGGNP
jgi:hypothetical protein